MFRLSKGKGNVCKRTTKRESCITQTDEKKEVKCICGEGAEHATHPCVCSNLCKQQPQDTQSQHTQSAQKQLYSPDRT